jgi:peroxiredoxin Q/BCP
MLAGGMFAVLALVAGGQPNAKDVKKVNLEVGDRAPEFEAPDEQGRTWQSTKHVGKKIVVVYFYPGDFTPGCTAQAQKFRDNMNKISDLGAEVVGISGDSPATHALFKLAHKLNFSLLADEEGAVANQFGVAVGKGAEVKTKDADKKPLTLKRAVTTARWTFIIGLDGKIAYKNTKVDPVTDSKQVEAFLQKKN